MAEEGVWVRFLDSTLCFGSKNGRLCGDRICKKWKLDPESLVIGSYVIYVGDDGLSEDTLVRIRQRAGAGAGDGKSEDTPFLLRASSDLKTSEKLPDAAAAMGACERVWESFQAQRMPPASAFKRYYAGCKEGVMLCTIRDKVSLLWQDLDQPCRASQELLELQQGRRADLWIVLGASGAGKTRTMYELGVSQLCIFLTGAEVNGRSQQGSLDLQLVMRKLDDMYAGHLMIPESAMECCMAALFVERLYLLKKTQELMGDNFSNLAWLFKQTNFKELPYAISGLDPFKAVLRVLLGLVTKENQAEMLNVFERMIADLRAATKWDGIVIIDECQIASTWLRNRFLSEGESPQLVRNFLDKCVVAIRLCDMGSCAYVCGTGASVFEMLEEVSGTAKELYGGFEVFTSFGGFHSAGEIKAYTKRFLDVPSTDFNAIFSIFRGRYRLYTSALEHYINFGIQGDRDLTEFVLHFAVELATMLTIPRTLKTVFYAEHHADGLFFDRLKGCTSGQGTFWSLDPYYTNPCMPELKSLGSFHAMVEITETQNVKKFKVGDLGIWSKKHLRPSIGDDARMSHLLHSSIKLDDQEQVQEPQVLGEWYIKETEYDLHLHDHSDKDLGILVSSETTINESIWRIP